MANKKKLSTAERIQKQQDQLKLLQARKVYEDAKAVVKKK